MIVNHTAANEILGLIRFVRWHPPKDCTNTFIGFTGWTSFLHESAQRDNVGRLASGSILEVLEQLRLIGVLDFQPFTLCVVSGSGIQINFKDP